MSARREEYDLLTKLSGLMEGTIALDASVPLAQTLRENADARRLYLRLVTLEVNLEWTRKDRPQILQIPALAEAPLKPTVLSHSVVARSVRWLTPQFAGLAASLLLVGYFVALGGLLVWDRIHPGTDRSIAEAANSPLASLTSADDANWQPMDRRATNEVASRTLHVRSGFAELEFSDGAKVVVEGPAEFEVRTKNRGFLRHGKLVATVPRKAIGFTIETPTATVVDLGTEFGVEVGESGATDVQVLKGKIELHPSERTSDASRARQSLMLSAGSAVRVEFAQAGGTPVVRKIAAETDRFTHSEPHKSRRIYVSGALSSSCFSEADLSVNNLINGSGLTKERHCDTSEGHTMWHSAVGKVKNEYLLFDLARLHRLESIKVWNYNVQYLDMYRWRGVKQADIYISSGSKGTPLDHPEEWTLVAEDVQFDPATGTPEYDTPTTIPLRDVTARFVAIVIDEALGHDPRPAGSGTDLGDLVGLSEVQFFGVRANLPKKSSP